MFGCVVEHVTALAQCGEICRRVVTRIVIKVRTGKDDIGHAHRGQIDTADRNPLTAGRPPTAKIAIPPPTIAQMRNEPQVRARALFTTRARPLEADGVGELLPVYGV
jgi:hypothetical protein